MRKKRLLDTFAILAWLLNEPHAGQVQALLQEARQDTSEFFITLINLGELYYTLRRGLSVTEVKNLITQLLAVPVTVVPVTEALVWESAEIKARNPLSYADCFAVAAARQLGASVITGDREFKRIEGMVQVEWI